MTDVEECRDRGWIVHTVGSLVWLAVWLWPLIGPAIDTATGGARPVLPAAAGLAAFVVLYLAVMLLAWQDQPTPPLRLGVLLGALTAVGLALTAGYADSDHGWLALPLFIGVAGVSAFRPPWQAALWTIGSVGTIGLVAVVRDVDDGVLGGYALSAVLAAALVYVVRQMNRLIADLRSTRAALARSAVEQERLRFARDLHDLLGHTLSVMVVKAEAVRRLAGRDPALAAEQGADIERIGRQALVEVREAVTGYRQRSLAVELDGARTALADAGIELAVRDEGGPDLPPAVADVFGWAVREGVTNVIRHGRAGRCEIEIGRRDGCATLEIRNDGPVVTGQPRLGYGLRGLSERVLTAGGTLEMGGCPGGGFHLTVTIPQTAPILATTTVTQ